MTDRRCLHHGQHDACSWHISINPRTFRAKIIVNETWITCEHHLDLHFHLDTIYAFLAQNRLTRIEDVPTWTGSRRLVHAAFTVGGVMLTHQSPLSARSRSPASRDGSM